MDSIIKRHLAQQRMDSYLREAEAERLVAQIKASRATDSQPEDAVGATARWARATRRLRMILGEAAA